MPYARNARTHSDEQIGQIAASIREWGWTMPVLVDEGGQIIAGHARTRAAQALGLDEVPVVVARGWSDAQRRAYVLADNKLAENAGWDFGVLASELAAIDTGDFDMSLIGFNDDELEQVATWTPPGLKEGLTDPEDAPPVPVVPVSRLGDLWMMGRHRLICGDCTNAETIHALIGDAKPDMILADPPYGIGLDTRYSRAPRGSTRCALKGREPAMRDFPPVIGDDKPFNARSICDCFATTKEQFWFGADYYRRTLSDNDRDGSWLVWDKRSEQTDSVVGSGFELIWSKQPHKRDVLRVYWNGAFGAADARGRKHPTQKPIELLVQIILRWSQEGAVIVDPFVGSGSTIISSEKSRRICYAAEIAPAYVDVSLRRWQDFTGHEATLEGDGRTFAEVAHERLDAEVIRAA